MVMEKTKIGFMQYSYYSDSISYYLLKITLKYLLFTHYSHTSGQGSQEE